MTAHNSYVFVFDFCLGIHIQIYKQFKLEFFKCLKKISCVCSSAYLFTKRRRSVIWELQRTWEDVFLLIFSQDWNIFKNWKTVWRAKLILNMHEILVQTAVSIRWHLRKKSFNVSEGRHNTSSVKTRAGLANCAGSFQFCILIVLRTVREELSLWS